MSYLRFSDQVLLNPPVYFVSSVFRFGLASVCVAGKYGYIDKSGSLAIPAKYDFSRAFALCGLARFEKNGKWGFIDTKGDIVIKPQFEDTHGFPILDTTSPQYAPVQVGEKWGYIDDKGEMVIQPQFDSAFGFNSGAARVCKIETIKEYSYYSYKYVTRKNIRYGYIDRNGNIIINIKYPGASDFSDGVATVNNSRKTHAINTAGELLFDTDKYIFISKFSEGVAFAMDKDSSYCCVNYQGVKLIEGLKYQKVYHFAEGLASFMKNDKWGFLDKHFKEVIPPQFDKTYYFPDFSEGIAIVRKDGKNVFIDKTGKVIKEITIPNLPVSSFEL